MLRMGVSYFITLNVEKCQINLIMIPIVDHDYYDDNHHPCLHNASKLIEEDLHLQHHIGWIMQMTHAQVHANQTTHIHTYTEPAHTRTHTHTHAHTHTHTHTHGHYPVVAGVDVGHRSIQRVCCFEAVVNVNTTEGIS